MASYKALYGHPYRAPQCWAEIGERRLLGPELVQAITAGNHVFLKVSPMKDLMRFSQKGKLAPHFIGPFKILDSMRAMAYRLALPTALACIHNVFHISMLKKYTPIKSHIISWEKIELTDNASYTKEPIRILDHKEQVLRTKTIPLVKVLWSHHGEEEAMWEREAEVREKYPHLFSGIPQDGTFS
ncbi:uncharacterized protein LOC131250646 [Magnolia sinica]|uniref:uncharacterized protein LOC131250646 n=1 Tax=Magnolia sinica TaxID=86752 RepID=UPI0026596134|nr:uncharacterized protein LOC131250646 [Magnolia sinica]